MLGGIPDLLHDLRTRYHILAPARVPTVRWVPRGLNSRANDLAQAALFQDDPTTNWYDGVLHQWLASTASGSSAFLGTFDGAYSPKLGGAWGYTIHVAFLEARTISLLAERAVRVSCGDAYEAECAGLRSLLLDLVVVLTNLRTYTA